MFIHKILSVSLLLDKSNGVPSTSLLMGLLVIFKHLFSLNKYFWYYDFTPIAITDPVWKHVCLENMKSV